MGQSVSKQVGKQTVEKAAGGNYRQRQILADDLKDHFRQSTKNDSMASRENDSQPKAANPGFFFRGDAPPDIRDVRQEIYLQKVHKIDDLSKGPPEMPNDLMKFIQDVGPVKQSIDEEFTSPRLLTEEGKNELGKSESGRRSKRIRMPLMGGDESFTTTRNVNFVHSSDAIDAKDFGTTNLQLYQFLTKGASSGLSDSIAVVDEFYKTNTADQEVWTEKEREEHKQMLHQVLSAIELPALVKDSDGNLLGIYRESVPGPEVRALQLVPDTKVKLVLEDLASPRPEHQPASIGKARVRRSPS